MEQAVAIALSNFANKTERDIPSTVCRALPVVVVCRCQVLSINLFVFLLPLSPFVIQTARKPPGLVVLPSYLQDIFAIDAIFFFF